MKFSIRELMVLTLAIALGAGWIAERRSLRNDLEKAEEKAQEAQREARQSKDLVKILAIQGQRSESRTAVLEEQVIQIEKQLPAQGVDLWLQGDTGHSGPVVKRRYPAY